MAFTASRRRMVGCAVSFGIVLCCPVATLGEDATIDRLLASQCAQCHGTDGYAVGDIDELAGERFKDLNEDMRDMQREDRPENIMDHQALGYTEEQIRRIAAYYAALPEHRSGEE
ncbi:MAG: c-type cytochrome [Gammaproteobacteria bacterium]